MKLFIVNEYIMATYRQLADEHGYVISETPYEDEYEVTHPDKPEFNETASSEVLLCEYNNHKRRAGESYIDELSELLYNHLDKDLIKDSIEFNLPPNVYLTILDELQCALYRLAYLPKESPETIKELVKTQSFKQLQSMYDAVCRYDV